MGRSYLREISIMLRTASLTDSPAPFLSPPTLKVHISFLSPALSLSLTLSLITLSLSLSSPSHRFLPIAAVFRNVALGSDTLRCCRAGACKSVVACLPPAPTHWLALLFLQLPQRLANSRPLLVIRCSVQLKATGWREREGGGRLRFRIYSSRIPIIMH